MADQNNDIDILIADERHSEITVLLKKLLDAFNTASSKDAKLEKLLSQKSELFDVLLSKWKEAAAPEIPAPNVTIQTDQSKVIKAVEDSADELAKNDARIIELLEQLIVIRGADVDLIVKRDYGVIEKVTAKIILPNKSKYQA